MAPPKVFSLEGKGLKLDTAEDVEAHIKPLVESTVKPTSVGTTDT